MSRPYAEVIGDPIALSKSPAIHGFWIEKLGLDAGYRAKRVTNAELAGYLAKRETDSAWRGCNITMPLKQVVLPLLHSIDGPAQAIGAVNTVYPAFDRLLAGTNTDAAGFLEPLKGNARKSALLPHGSRAGDGGAARAIVAALAKERFTIVLAGRDPAKARALLDVLDPGGQHHAVALHHFANSTEFAFDGREGCCDLVVNASPLGMRGQPPLQFDWSHAPPNSIAYDVVTDPVDTPFLVEAREAGFATIDGLEMLVGQAALAFERFFGVAPPREHDAELRARLCV